MFYALLSESDDSAADSPLSQQPLISIAVSFNLVSLVVFPWACHYCASSLSYLSFFSPAELWRVKLILLLSPPPSVLWRDVSFKHIKVSSHRSLCCCFFILPSSDVARWHFKMCNNLLDQKIQVILLKAWFHPLQYYNIWRNLISGNFSFIFRVTPKDLFFNWKRKKSYFQFWCKIFCNIH